MRNTGRRRGLRRLSSDFIAKARDETATQVTRIGLTFLGTSAFCLLSLLSPDSALLGSSERINVPFAGPVSFFGFMLLGPAVLIVLRVYLQIYVEHSLRLERLARSMSIVRAPMLAPLQNPLIRYFSGLVFYLLLPLTILLFAWKAAVFPTWGSGLLGVAGAVVSSHIMLLLQKYSWRSKALLSTGAAIVVFAMILAVGPVRRPFALFRADLSGQWLVQEDLRGANLSFANFNNANLNNADLTGANLWGSNLIGTNMIFTKLRDAELSRANLTYANLSGAFLTDANLRGANLTGANMVFAEMVRADLIGADLVRAKLGADLSGAALGNADLSGADLMGANLTGANLSNAKLSGAENLTQEQLDKACGDKGTKLPAGLTLKSVCK